MLKSDLARRHLLGLAAMALVAGAFSQPVQAALGFSSLLGDASDKALDKLSEKDGFYRDTAVRILLPGTTGKFARSILDAGDKLGVTSKLTRSLNDAASFAAKEAKPVFRSAINNLKLTDVPGIVAQKDGATQYLKSSSGDVLKGKIRPLVESALGKVGAYNQLDRLNQQKGLLGQGLGVLKINRDTLSDSVTDQTMKGIFSYMGKEEGVLRGKLGGVGDLLGGIIK